MTLSERRGPPVARASDPPTAEKRRALALPVEVTDYPSGGDLAVRDFPKAPSFRTPQYTATTACDIVFTARCRSRAAGSGSHLVPQSHFGGPAVTDRTNPVQYWTRELESFARPCFETPRKDCRGRTMVT